MDSKGFVPDYPALFKHMALAIYRDGRLSGSDGDRFTSALEITLFRLREYRLVSSDSSLTRVSLTPRGTQLNNEHLRESSSKSKTRMFDLYYKQLKAEGEAAPANLAALEQGAAQAPAPKPVLRPQNAPVVPAKKQVRPKTPSRINPRANKNSPQKPKTAPKTPSVKRASKVTRAKRG